MQTTNNQEVNTEIRQQEGSQTIGIMKDNQEIEVCQGTFNFGGKPVGQGEVEWEVIEMTGAKDEAPHRGVYPENSDKIVKAMREDEEHFHCKRFKEEGRAPPFPPVGVQFFINDGADSIDYINQKSLQTTQHNFSICQIDNQFIGKQNQENLTKETTFTEDEKYPTEEHDNNHFMNTYNKKQENVTPKVVVAAMPQFEFEFTRKRDQKAQGKINVHETKLICKGCQLKYNKLKFQGFCHNCFKIYEAVEQFVAQHDGIFNFIENTCEFELMCQRRHHWTVEFKTKQVKKWCKTCKKSERVMRKEYFKKIDEEKQKQFEQMQREMFEEAKRARVTQAAETTQRRNFLDYLVGDDADERIITPQIMEDIVIFILNEPEQRLEQFFLQFPKENRMRVFRRLARMIHPDKNPHQLAKEAFQKLLSSSWRNCTLREMMNFNFQFEEDFVPCF